MKKILPLILGVTLLLSACKPYTPPGSPQYGGQAWLGITPLTGTVDPGANGAAIARFFEKGRYAINVQLNIDQAPKGKTYYAWVEKPGTTERELLGELISPTGDVRHLLSFNTEKDLREYRNVYVTLQNNGVTTFPGTSVAKGTIEDSK